MHDLAHQGSQRAAVLDTEHADGGLPAAFLSSKSKLAKTIERRALRAPRRWPTGTPPGVRAGRSKRAAGQHAFWPQFEYSP
jgi:hypothetical protein